jgi:hypothetical protein
VDGESGGWAAKHPQLIALGRKPNRPTVFLAQLSAGSQLVITNSTTDYPPTTTVLQSTPVTPHRRRLPDNCHRLNPTALSHPPTALCHRLSLTAALYNSNKNLKRLPRDAPSTSFAAEERYKPDGVGGQPLWLPTLPHNILAIWAQPTFVGEKMQGMP